MQIAVRLANQADVELVLAHVWHVPAVSYETELAYPTGAMERLIAEAKHHLANAVRDATDLGARRVSSRFVAGLPRDQIVELAADPAIELVVIGTRGRSGIAELRLGSVAAYVVRHAPCSVLAVHEHDRIDGFRRVLFPIDFSDSSRRAVELAPELVDRGDDAKITLLHVIEPPITLSGEPTLLGLDDALKQHVTAVLAQWATQVQATIAVPVATRSRIGDPAAQVLDVLRESPPFDLAIVGSHGRTGFRRLLLGSVAEKLVRHSPCPVLVARKR